MSTGDPTHGGTIGPMRQLDHPGDTESPEPPETLLPDWYMPTPAGGVIRGWRRAVAVLIIAAFLAITAYGLCNTYGDLLL